MEAQGDSAMLGLLVPSPQSEAVTHELEELTLQPNNSLPPLNERKNGKHNLPFCPDFKTKATFFILCFLLLYLIFKNLWHQPAGWHLLGWELA